MSGPAPSVITPAMSAPPPAAPAAGGAPPPAAPNAAAALSNTPPPAAPAAGGAPTPAPAAAPAADWLGGMEESAKGFVANKGWKTPGEMLGSYQNLEKLVGHPADKLLRLPTDGNPEGMKEIYSKLGCPQTPKEYGFNDDAAKGGNPDFAKWAGENFQSLGLSVKQGQELAGRFEKYAADLQAAQTQAQLDGLKLGAENLRKEWGAAHDQNTAVAKRGAAVMGVDKATLDKIESAIGFDGVMKLFYNMGAKTGEASFHSGAPGDGALTPAAAAEKINQLKADPGFVKRYTEGDAAAKQEMQRLHQMMAPGESFI